MPSIGVGAWRAAWGSSKYDPPRTASRSDPPLSGRDKQSVPMPIRLDARSPDFAARFRAFLDAKREASADVEEAVREIIADVAARGDAALVELTRKFDRVDL